MERPRLSYEDLPPECLLRIIAFLNLSEVVALLQTSRLWNSVITSNEQVVYHQLARLCKSMDQPLGSLHDAIEGWASQESMKVQNWKRYCQLQVATTRRWHGKGRAYSSYDVFGSAQQTEAHRIKIDTGKALLVMTGEGETNEADRCVAVHCLRNPSRQALFRLTQVSPYPHLEMSNGFIVFTCGRSDLLEVWRWAEDQDIDPLERGPTEQQLLMYQGAMATAGFQLGLTYRGELVPMGMLKHQAQLRASRLVYPTLCVGSEAGDHIWLWDIRTRRLTQTINLKPCEYQQFSMLYVDVNEAHVFVATHTVSVYSRASGQCVFQLPELHLKVASECTNLPVFNGLNGFFEESRISGYHNPSRNATSLRPYDIIRAVHVSPTGEDFVAATYRGYVLHVSGFDSVFSNNHKNFEEADNPTDSPGIFSALQSPTPNTQTKIRPENLRISVMYAERTLSNLAYDGRKILIYGINGISLIHLGDQSDNTFEVQTNEGLEMKLHPFPSTFIYQIPPFGSRDGEYWDCSCLQMTQDSFWVAWSTGLHDNRRPTRVKVVGMMDFAREFPNEA